MGKPEPATIPAWARWSLRIAACLVPAAERLPWRRRAENSLGQLRIFLRDRGATRRTIAAHSRRFLSRAFQDSFDRRFPGETPLSLIRRWARSPTFALASLAALFLTVLVVTGMFSGMRAAFAPLPYAEPSRLVACFQLHFLSASLGAQSRYFRPWRDRSATLESLAAYRIREYELDQEGFRPALITGADVTPGFFPLLGVRALLGRTFTGDDEPARDPPAVVVTYRFWRQYLRGSADLSRLSVQLDGQLHRVLGVLPEPFWFRSPQLAVFTPMPEPGGPGSRSELMGFVGRLRFGQTAEAAKTELQRIALSTRGIRSGPVRVLPLAEYQQPALSSLLAIALASVGLALAIAGVQFGRIARKPEAQRAEGLRFWGFFAAKVGVLAAVLALSASELAARNALSLGSGKFLFNLVLEWLVILGILLVFRWAILDQGRRCPVCLRRLAMPATTGAWSSLLINPAGTELLCDQGHGALTVSATGGLAGEVRRWITLEDDWRALAGAGDGK